MKVGINEIPYTINSLEEINTLVPPEEIIALGFYMCFLTKLPENIFRYNTNLNTVDLCHNDLTELPENIFRYNTNLTSLNLGHNKLTELPENIFRYTKLTSLRLNSNKLTELPDNIFRYNTNLQYLNLDNNNLTTLPENIFRYNTNLIELHLHNNNITNLPENILQYNANLHILYLSNNKLIELPENILRYNAKLEDLFLYGNNLTELPANVFRYNTNLQKLYLDTNNLTDLPDNIFKNNTNLQKLDLGHNNLTELPENIFKYNTNLLELILKYNMLKQLPISLLTCNKLKLFKYDELNYIPPNMQRFLYRLKNQLNYLQIYNDGENVHNHKIQESVMNSINNILNIPKTINREHIMQYIVDSNSSYTSKKLLFEYCGDDTIHSVLYVTFGETLLHMFQYIVDHLPEKLDDIMQILDIEIQDSECKCFTSRLSRLINCLSGISDLVEKKNQKT